MPFTDDNLKRLKEENDSNGQCNYNTELHPNVVLALLSRLEASEQVIQASVTDKETDEYREWKKLCGL